VSRQIIINATREETRVVTMESARILQVQIERRRERGLVGSIYKGRVTRVLPGMQAAFVDIGLPKAAFLPAADFLALGAIDGGDAADGDGDGDHLAGAAAEGTRAGDRAALPPIEERLRKGQEIIVQIAKEPIGSKGARVTSNVSLPGRLLVYLPTGDHIGVSKRIEDEDERQRLQEAVTSVPSLRGGVIARTACVGVPKREIQGDLRMLRKLVAPGQRQGGRGGAAGSSASGPRRHPAHGARHPDPRRRQDRRRQPPRLRADSSSSSTASCRAGARASSSTSIDEPIFERYGVEAQIAKALEPRVWLRSGGYIVIDPTEALDFDRRQHRPLRRPAPTSATRPSKTNLEAARDDRRAAAPAQPRRRHRHRLHRHAARQPIARPSWHRPATRRCAASGQSRRGARLLRARPRRNDPAPPQRESRPSASASPAPPATAAAPCKATATTAAYEILRKPPARRPDAPRTFSANSPSPCSPAVAAFLDRVRARRDRRSRTRASQSRFVLQQTRAAGGADSPRRCPLATRATACSWPARS
jgi:hypothetical protein